MTSIRDKVVEGVGSIQPQTSCLIKNPKLGDRVSEREEGPRVCTTRSVQPKDGSVV